VAKRPSRPSGARRPAHVRRTASPWDSPLDRAYAQKLRSDRTLTFVSMASRVDYWTHQTQALARQNEQNLEQANAEISQGSVKETATGFASANIESATLESAVPALPGEGAIAGISESGFIPPPPAN
jgi:hypothetical protein